MKSNIAFSTVSRARASIVLLTLRTPKRLRSEKSNTQQRRTVHGIDRSWSLCFAIDHFGVRLPSVRYSFALYPFNHDIQFVPVPGERANAVLRASVPLILCIRSEITKRKCIQQTSRSWHSGCTIHFVVRATVRFWSSSFFSVPFLSVESISIFVRA